MSGAGKGKGGGVDAAAAAELARIRARDAARTARYLKSGAALLHNIVLDAAHDAALDRIRKRHGCATRAAAVRVAIEIADAAR
ncbi:MULTISPECIES: hypothetical protein [Metallibacterium]|jgi:hypothetical protein|uniref:hypothetical protein n=1 Tax=Metallibacterium TaxID=1218803 RepID=UPI0026274016|nr:MULTISPECIES: hypothetical protein [Metallibacterium]MBW8075253.1 hypothetical protein [Metallibacterium scheffleri]